LRDHLTVKIALKIDVDNLRPALVGVPRLADVLETQAAGASFLFNLGPDRSGRHTMRFLRRGMPVHLWRTRSIRDYGIASYLYGTLLPAPDIGARAAGIIRTLRDAEFETGVRSHDHMQWRTSAAHRDDAWVEHQMGLAARRYQEITGETARVHAAPGWQMNRHAYRLTQRLGYAYSSDTRGTHPFIPVYRAEVISCPQLPTTLPTVDELLAQPGFTREKIVPHILSLTAHTTPWGHVFTANAAFEGLKLLTEFEDLLRGWRQQGHEIVSLHDYMLSIDTREVPYHEVVAGTVPGRPHTVALQGKEFLS
jgi:peptidoglycan/xylan/chitin deacetylase (PgdA/CDA1 family)